ncbi:MAG: FecR family protein [Candidatus Methylarchaceae archaeon HK02M2]|nr:FecR family protein [Candidatus Methylarchaceae archaeon HK02M2]
MKKLLMVFIISITCLMICLSAFANVIGAARLSLIKGDVVVQRNDIGTEWVVASINLPLMPGDRVWVTENGRLEIQLLGGSYIRADNNTSVDITNLSRDCGDNITQVAVSQGRTYINYKGSADNNSVFQVDTPLISAMAYSSAKFNVYVYEDGYTEVSVINGTVYVEGMYGNTKVDSGDMISVDTNNYAKLSPRRPNDEWLSWNLSRDSYIARTGISIKYLPATLDIYCVDFDQYGHWVHTPDYGYVWSPSITDITWAPYRKGRWIWMNDDYVWISYEPWGWVPYHYGRWALRVGIGWFWVPPALNDVFWGPGFVAWIYTPTYVSWVPLAPSEMYYGHGYYGYHSVNITKVNIKNVIVTNVYLNSKVAHAVTVVHHDNFVKGVDVKVTNAPANPFLARLKLSVGRPSVKQINLSSLPLKVVQQKHLPPKTTLDTKRTIGLTNRNSALSRNISVFKGSKPISSMHVNVFEDPKSISSNQKLRRVEPRATPQVSNQVQRQESRSTTLSNNTVRRVEPRATPQVSNQVQRQESRRAFAPNNNQTQR